AALSVIVLRGDLLEIIPAMATFGASLVLAAFASLCSFAAAIVIWREGLNGIGRAVAGFFIGCALLAYPAYLGYLAYRLAPIHNITTDPRQAPAVCVVRPPGPA